MAYLQTHFFSRTLNVAVEVEVLLPEPDQGIGQAAASAEALPAVLYLLHGYSDDQTIWMRRTSIERYAAEHNLAVVMPAVNHSFYTNEPMGERYWDFVSEELPMVMHRLFHLSQRREDTFAAGLSMGGYGALKLALTHPDRFAAVGCFSGVLDVAGRMGLDVPNLSLARVFGTAEQVRGSENDLYHLLTIHAGDAVKPRLFLACGTSDFLYDQFCKFVPRAKALGWDVTATETPDVGHEWRFWDAKIAEFIPFMLK